MTFVSLFLLSWAFPAFAESGDLPRVIKRADGGAAGSSSSSSGGLTQEESNAVFKLDSGPAPKTSKSLSDPGKERSVGPEPELNTAARDAILRRCEPLREKSMDQFRACYQKEKEAELERVRRSFDRTNRGDAYRTAPGASGGM